MSSAIVVENVVMPVVKKEVNPKLPAKYTRIYQCVWEVLNSCVSEPSNNVALTEELMEGILGVMGFYGELSEQLEFFDNSIFEKESLKATKKGMKAHLKMAKMKFGLSEEAPKKKKERKAKDPNAPKKERKPKDPNAPKKERKPKDPNAPKKERKVKEAVVVVPEVVAEPEVEVVPEVVVPVVAEPEVVANNTPVLKEEKPKAKKVKKTKVLVDVPVEN